MDQSTNSLAQQRYQLAIENITRFYQNERGDRKDFQIVDLGCAGAKFFHSVKDFHDTKEDNIQTYYFGVDIDACHLHLEATNSLRPRARLELNDGRVAPLHAVLLEGDLWTPDDRLRGTDVVTMLEVIEYLEPEEVYQRLPLVLFGDWRPSLLILSTPNRESGCSEPSKRPSLGNDDASRPSKSGHNKFEWDQIQFAHWCLSAATVFNYSVEILPVGSQDSPKSLMAVFKRYDLEEPLIDCPTDVFYKSVYQVEYHGGKSSQSNDPYTQAVTKLNELSVKEDATTSLQIDPSMKSNDKENKPTLPNKTESETPALSPGFKNIQSSNILLKSFLDSAAAVDRLTSLYYDPESTDHRPEIELRQVAERVLLHQLLTRWKDFDHIDLQAYSNKLTMRGDCHLADECENNLELLSRRQRDIDLVKSGTDYARYLCLVGKSARLTGEPRTPNKFRQRSRRNWESHVKEWRQQVHEWNRSHPDSQLSSSAQAKEFDSIREPQSDQDKQRSNKLTKVKSLPLHDQNPLAKEA